MSGAPTHLLVDPAKRNVEEWNRWRFDNLAAMINLRSLDLRGADLTGANLRRVDLTYTNMTDCSLAGALLDCANMFGCLLVRADMSTARLRYANLGLATMADATLNGADARGANFHGAGVATVSLLGADLSESVGLAHPDVCPALTSENLEPWVAHRDPGTGRIRISIGPRDPFTIDSLDELRSVIADAGGPYEKVRLAWADLAEAHFAMSRAA